MWLGNVPLALVSLIATLGYLALFVALHVLPTGYHPVQEAVSDYAVGPYGYLFRAGLYVSSLGVLALAFLLVVGVGSPPVASRDLVYLLAIPLTRIGMTLFPTDLEGTARTRTGILHYACAIAAFTLTYLAISGVTPTLIDVAQARWLGDTLHVVSVIVAASLILVVVTMAGPLRRVFGLTERIFLVTTNLWFALAALLVLTMS